MVRALLECAAVETRDGFRKMGPETGTFAHTSTELLLWGAWSHWGEEMHGLRMRAETAQREATSFCSWACMPGMWGSLLKT